MKVVKYIDSRLLKENMSEVMINSAIQHNNIVRFFYYDIEEIKNQKNKNNVKYNIYSYIELMDYNLYDEIMQKLKDNIFYNKTEVINILT